jgi:hypothetical protein
MPQTITLRPIYGWGWGGASGEGRDVPTSFSVTLDEVMPGKWNGRIISPEHEFFGLVAYFSRRHRDWDGVVNIHLKQGDPDHLLVGRPDVPKLKITCPCLGLADCRAAQRAPLSGFEPPAAFDPLQTLPINMQMEEVREENRS